MVGDSLLVMVVYALLLVSNVTAYSGNSDSGSSSASSQTEVITTLGQRILTKAIEKPPGYHDITPPKLMFTRPDGRPALYIETLNNPLPTSGIQTTTLLSSMC